MLFSHSKPPFLMGCNALSLDLMNQFRHQISKMAVTGQDKTLSQNAIEQLRNEDSTFSQFKMVDGVQPVLLLPRHSTNMENRLLASRMVKADKGGPWANQVYYIKGKQTDQHDTKQFI